MTPFTETRALRTIFECPEPALNIWDVMQGNPRSSANSPSITSSSVSPGARRNWGFPKLRVITVVWNSEKQVNLCAQLAGFYSHRIFWVTNEQAVRENIGGNIFTTPKGWTKVGYLFTKQ
jgi:hypothetical protein